MASVAKYMTPPTPVITKVGNILLGFGTTKSRVAITDEAIIYLPVAFHGKLKAKHLCEITYLHRSITELTIRLIRATYVAASNGFFAKWSRAKNVVGRVMAGLT